MMNIHRGQQQVFRQELEIRLTSVPKHRSERVNALNDWLSARLPIPVHSHESIRHRKHYAPLLARNPDGKTRPTARQLGDLESCQKNK